VERHEILSSRVLGYLSEAISEAKSFCSRNIVSSLSNGLRPHLMPFTIYSMKNVEGQISSRLVNLY
jgi:hypothetical protein